MDEMRGGAEDCKEGKEEKLCLGCKNKKEEEERMKEKFWFQRTINAKQGKA